MGGTCPPPKCIIGDMSTALVNAVALYNIKAVSINRLLEEKDKTLKRVFEPFNRNFGKLVYIPENFDDLLGYLEELCNE